MVGIPGKTPPTTNAEWARSVEQRLNAIQGPTEAVQVGAWVLATDDGGNLVATTIGQTVALTPGPEEALESATAAAAAAEAMPQTMSARVTIAPGTTGGTFTLTFNSLKLMDRGIAVVTPTGDISFQATSIEVHDALVASGDYKTTDFLVYGATGTSNDPSGPFIIVHFAGVLTANGTNLTGVNPGVTVT